MRVFDGSEFRRSSRHLERLSLQPIFHSKCLILSAEDLLCCCYRRIWQKITSCAPFQGLASDIWDLLSLVECCSFSQDALRQILLEDKMTAQVSFIHSFLQSFTGKPLPDSLPTFQNQDDAIRTFFEKESSRIQGRYDFLGNRKQSLWTLAAKRMPSVARWTRRILRR